MIQARSSSESSLSSKLSRVQNTASILQNELRLRESDVMSLENTVKVCFRSFMSDFSFVFSMFIFYRIRSPSLFFSVLGFLSFPKFCFALSSFHSFFLIFVDFLYSLRVRHFGGQLSTS